MGDEMIGKFAKSKAGHDKDTIYIIIKEDTEYVYLVDGKYKTIDRPKKKRKKHIQPILKDDEQITQKLKNSHVITNEDIKKAIKKSFDRK